LRVWLDRSFLHALYVVPWLDLMAWSWVLAALSEQYGFIVASFAYIIVYFRNTNIWYKDSLGGEA
jgi:hypothetical protein